jgi:hypothetical protein
MKKKSFNFVAVFGLTITILLGGVVRFYPVLLSNFPLNDGGLFFQMTEDILNNHFTLPLYTSYNGGMIPFAYPPLPFYLMALLQRFLHFGIIDQLRFLPAIFSTLCIPALYFLSRSITGSKTRSIFAVFAYALIPQSYLWLIMGGGVTRALGVLFGILALIFIWEMFREPRYTSMLFAILFSSLGVYCHLGTTWFVFLSSIVIFFKFGINKIRMVYAISIIIGVLILSSPWWGSIMGRYGISLLFNAFQTGGFLKIPIILFNLTYKPLANIIAAIALLGIFAEVVRRKYFLPLWLLLLLIFSARGGPSYISIPESMLFGSGVVWVLVPGLMSYSKHFPKEPQTLTEIMHVWITKLVMGIILFFTFFTALAIPLTGINETRSLSRDEQLAMEWTAQNTSPDSQFVILTGNLWSIDQLSEWFPALSSRKSTATVQGSEFLPDHTYTKLIDRYEKLQQCYTQNFSCIFTWASEYNIALSYMVVSKNDINDTDNSADIYSMIQSNQLRLVFDNPGVSIYQVIYNP